MAKIKNAIRKHEVAPVVIGEDGAITEVTEADYFELAHLITDIVDNTTDQTLEQGYYSGDGTPELEITGYVEEWTITGLWDSKDPAQKLIKDKKRTFGDSRRVWHKVTETDGTVIEGLATATDIKAGTGAAVDYEPFEVTLRFNGMPNVTEAVPAG